ncbi:MAG: tetratricopeptide repeat protein [Proteobacteria bacterium]|nr:tetratricopeptide repeat protein [Pseudomonadota bacterium]
MNNFFSELKRRNVVRVGIAYVVVSWVILQFVDIIQEIVKFPGWFPQMVLVLLIIGLPIALIFSWAYEVTPEGVKKTAEVDKSSSITHGTGQKINKLIIGALVLAVGFLLVDKFYLSSEKGVVEKARAGQVTIAVLPFSDLSPEGDQEYFGDGIAEELLNVLFKVDDISVVSRTSSFAFKGQSLSIPEIANQLGVNYILEGSVRKSNNRVRITAQLIDVKSDRHMWSETYNRELDDIFEIQDEIAVAIGEALSFTFGKTVVSTNNVEAYDLYLLGVYNWNKRTAEGLTKALETFEAAIKIDPNFAKAWAGLANTYLVISEYSDFDPEISQREARRAAQKAIELNPESAEARTAYAFTLLGNYSRAEEEFKRAISLNPKYPTAHHWYGVFLTEAERLDEGMAELQIAHELDPASLPIQNMMSINLMLQGRYEDALAENLEILARAPDYRNALWAMFAYNAFLGRAREGMPYLEQFFIGIGEDPDLATRFVEALENPTQREEFLKGFYEVLARTDQAGRQGQFTNYIQLVLMLGLLEDKDRVLANIRDGCSPRWFFRAPAFDFLKGEPDYEACVAGNGE